MGLQKGGGEGAVRLAELGRRLRGEGGEALPERYRALYGLRARAGDARAARELLAALADARHGALLRHEVAFALGQMQAVSAVEALVGVVRDQGDHEMVRHEAAEALGAIGEAVALPVLKEFQGDPNRAVSETCLLALQRMEYFGAAAAAGRPEEPNESPYASVDPTPARPVSTSTAALRRELLDEEAPIFDRYRAMFGLRNQGGGEALAALAAAFGSGSALLKHELAYVLGQMQDEGAVPALAEVLGDGRQDEMTRHEAAEALGAIARPACVSLLEKHCDDSSRVVAESCIVALDILRSEAAGEFQYADELPTAAAAASA